MKYNYGIAAYLGEHPDKLLHASLYDAEPELNDIKSLTLELEYDTEFGLGHIIHQLLFRYMTEEELDNLDNLEIYHIDDF